MKRYTVFCLMGPTATGKTELAISLYEKRPVEIVSVDSAMVYRHMNIGTGKPSTAELKKVPHHLIDICDPTDSYSAGQFCQDAQQKIKEIVARDRTPLLVGGTMLYFHKLLHGLAELPKANSMIRKQIDQEIKELGLSALHNRLKKIDPESAQKIKPQDTQRIQRALEIYLLTGKPISAFYRETQHQFLSEYDVKMIALIPRDRVWLHQRIEKRFEKMLQVGLVDEVRALHTRPDLNENMTAMRMVNYRHVWEYLEGKTNFETMKQKAMAATRQLAKRQLTWLRGWKNLMVLDPQNVRLQEDCITYFKTNITA